MATGQNHPSRGALDLLLSMGRDLMQDNPARATECLSQATELARDLSEPRVESNALLLLASLDLIAGGIDTASERVDRALTLARSTGDSPGAAAALNAGGRILLRQGRVEDALGKLRASLELTTELSPQERSGDLPDPRVETLELLGVAHTMAGHADQALRYYDEALEQRRAQNNPTGVAKVLNQLGNLRHRMGQYQEAVNCYTQALEHLESAGDSRGVAATANNLGSTYMRLGDMTDATRLFELCRQHLEKLGEQSQVAKILLNLGLLAQSRGRLGEAFTHYQESLKLHRKLGDAAGESYALVNLSLLALARGRPEEALARANEGLALLERGGSHDTLAPAWVCRGLALLELNQVDDAAQAAAEGIRAAEAAKARDQKTEALALLALVQLEQGDLAGASMTARQGLELAEEIEDPELLATAYRCVGIVQRTLGNREEAKEALTRAARYLRGWDDSYELARIRLEEGVLLALAGASEAAAERLRRVEDGFARLGNRRWQLLATLLLAEVIDRSDPAQARALRDRGRTVATEAGAPQLFESTHQRARKLVTGEASPLEAVGLWGTDLAPLAALALRLRYDRIGTASRQAAEAFGAFYSFLEQQFEVTALCLQTPHARLGGLLTRGAEVWHWPFAVETEGTTPTEAGPGHRLKISREPKEDAHPRSTNVHTPVTTSAIADLVSELHLTRPDREWATSELRMCEIATGLLALSWDVLLARAGDETVALERLESAARFDELVGAATRMQEIYRMISQVAPSDSNVLILGESGTGKELVARSIHSRSRRGLGPFIAISCPSIPRDLLESELFGHEKGAFTGAHEARPGKIEMADGGTLFLDEVGDMPLSTQVKILRFLEEREFSRVGGRQSKRVDVRLLSATSRDLTVEMRSGAFREDLFYRLNVVPIAMPALRERREDIPLLVAHFLQHLRPGDADAPLQITADSLERLASHEWPGNVRELRNTIEHMITLCDGPILETRHLPAILRDRPSGERDRQGDASRVQQHVPGQIVLAPGETLESRVIELEAALIRWALDQEDGNQSAAARRLGVTESKIRKRMKLYGIRRPGG